MPALWAVLKWAGGKILLPALLLCAAFYTGRHVGSLVERGAWQTKATKAALQRAAERDVDLARVQHATEAYAARVAALRPIVARSTETVIRYAETNAGRAPCLAAERVHGIEQTAAALGLHAAPDPGIGTDAMQPDTSPAARPR